MAKTKTKAKEKPKGNKKEKEIFETVIVDSTNKTKTVSKKTTYKKERITYDNKGTKNRTTLPDFVNICKKTQDELKSELTDKLLDAGYEDVISGNGYLYARGNLPILLTAHMDTVHKNPVEDFYEYYDKANKRHILSSPQGIGGDDRCGIYMILQIIKTHKCSVLFCEDEEIGGVGSDKFCGTKYIEDLSEMKYLIELDRANGNDAVFYDCDNPDFTNFIVKNTGYKKNYGSFSDISTLSPECGVASCNLSCGYYNAHTTSEYVVIEEMENTIEVVKKLLDVECEQFEFVDAYPNIYGWNKYDEWYGDCYGYSGYDYYGYSKRNLKNTCTKNADVKSLYLIVYDYKIDDCREYVSNGNSIQEALGYFFMDNPEYCFNDIQDYEMYDYLVCEDGWLS